MSRQGALRRGRSRWYWTWGATFVAIAVFGVVFVASSGASLSTSPFEGSDGNMIVNTSGHTDWCTDFPAPASGAPCTTPIAGLRTLIDVPSGTSDNSFTSGSHEDDPNVTIATGSVPPNKNDLTRAYAATQTISNETFLYLAWERQPNPNGSANIDFELDQNASAGDFTQPGALTINRTEGDILITYDFGGSGTPDLGLLTWLTSGHGHTSSDCEASGQKLPCWGNRIDLNPNSNPPAESGVNSATIDEVFQPGVQLDAGSFGEAKIDLSAVPGLFTPDTCTAFGSMFVKSRSSGSSIDAELKDFIAPAPVRVSNCASPTVATQTSVTTMNVDQTETVGDTATLSGGDNPTGDVSFQLYSDSACKNAVAGVSGTATLDQNGVATFAGASFTPTKAGTYYWGVSYPGDNHNNPVSACGGDNEEITVNAADVSITKTADHSAPVNAGDQIGFTVEVKNTGLGDATGVNLDDSLPGGSGTGVTWSIDTQSPANSFVLSGAQGKQTLSLASDTLPAGADDTVHIVAQTSSTECGVYDNTATLTTGNANNPDPASAEEDCLAPGLSLFKTADKALVDAGDPIGFKITVGNGGPGTADGVTLSDPLPAGDGSIIWSIDSQPAGDPCSLDSTTTNPQKLTCSFGDLAANASVEVHVTATTSFTECTTYDNTATASATNADPQQASASIECRTPDLSVTKTADAGTVNAGDPIGFTVEVANSDATGTGTAKNVTLDDPLPAGTASDWTIDPAYPGPGTCSITGASGHQKLDCAFGDMAPGDSASVHVVSSTSFADCAEYDNTATAKADNAPEVQDSASIVCQAPDLSITKTADATSVKAGDPIGFTITVSNSPNEGVGTAENVTLDDPLPGGTASNWVIDPAYSGPGSCSIAGASGHQELECSFGNIEPDNSVSVHVSSSTSFAACTTYNNTATASADNAPDVQASASIDCSSPDVSITKTADHSAPVHAGDQIGFTVEVKNTGEGEATGVKLADPLPAGSGSGVTWSIASQSPPNTFVLSGGKGSQTLSLASSTLPAGADYKVHIVASTSETECSVYDNTATLTTENANNPNPASASESCAYRVDLSITKTGSPATQNLGAGNITWTMVVTNNGPDTDTGVKVSDPLPAGTTFVSLQVPPPATCTGGAIISCDLGTMTAGQSITITLVTTPTRSGTISNTVMVVGDRPETNTANNSASASVVVNVFNPPQPVYCVAVSKITPNQLFVGRKTTLTIRLTKHGKAAAGVRVRIKGPKLNVTTKRSNSRGVVKRTVKVKKAGIMIFTPLASKRCNTKRVGVTGVFTPPVTG
jgi:uncharacterized repeat protein (TIGR01451 family)